MNEALFYKSVLLRLPNIVAGLFSGEISLSSLTDMLSGWPPSSAKPLHSFLIFLFSLPLGELSLFVGKFTSSVFAVADIFLIYFLIKALCGEELALLSTLFTASSGYFIYISRLAVPEADSIFFFLLFNYFYLKTGKKSFYLSALCLSLSILTCYRWIALFPVIFSYQAYEIFFLKKKSVRDIAVYWVIFTIPLIIADMPYWPFKLRNDLKISFSHMPQNIFSYMEQLKYYLFFQAKKGEFYPHILYFKFFIALNGFMFTLFSFIGIGFFLKRFNHKLFLIVAPPIFLFLLLSLKTRGNSLRYISLAIPYFAVFAANGFYFVSKNILKSDFRYSVVLLLLILLPSLINAYSLITIRSGYKKAAEWLELHNGKSHLNTSNSYFEFYFGRNVCEQVPSNINKLKSMLNSGKYKYVLFDFMAKRVCPGEVSEYVKKKFLKVKRIPNNIGKNPIYLMESLGYRHLIKDYIKNALSDEDSAYITIYKPNAA